MKQMSKEEVLDKELSDFIEYPHYGMNDFQRRSALSAMDLFAKEMAIGFAEFAEKNFSFSYGTYDPLNINLNRNKFTQEEYTPEQLYDEYLKQIQ